MLDIWDAFLQPILKAAPKIPAALMVFVVGYVVLVITRIAIKSSLKVARTHRPLALMLFSLINFALWVVLLALVLYSLGLGRLALALSSSVAIVGIVIATGTNALVADVIAGLYLAMDPDFNVGYTIKTADIEGIIEKIDLRKIRIRDKDGRLHVVPSSLFDKAQWVVLDEGEKK